MKYLSTREIQICELNILKKFIRFCDANKLQYWLYGGTALGAIRHRGFIPWDDDIDIIMPRYDYERLTNLIKDGARIDENLEIVIPELQRNPKYLIGKVYDKNIEVEAVNGHDSGYLWIDIMQLDGIPDEPEKYLKRLLKLRRIYLAKTKQKFHSYDGTKSRKDNIKRQIRSIPLLLINYRMFMKYFLRFCKKYDLNSSKLVSNTCWYNTPTKIFEKKWFRDTIKTDFEDIKANIFVGYDDFLTKRYGANYMEIPPKCERVTHSFKAWYVRDKKKS